MRGTVKFFNADKGYGFIVAEGDLGGPGRDILVHATNLTPGLALRENDTVEFNLTTDRRNGRPTAVDVKRL